MVASANGKPSYVPALSQSITYRLASTAIKDTHIGDMTDRPALHKEAELMLHKSSPYRQYEAINILRKGEIKSEKERKRLRPEVLRQRGELLDGLSIELTRPGVFDTLLLVRLKGITRSGQQGLKSGTSVILTVRPSEERVLPIMGLVSLATTQHVEVVIDKSDEHNLLSKENIELFVSHSGASNSRMLEAATNFREWEKTLNSGTLIENIPEKLVKIVRGLANPTIMKATLHLPTANLNGSQLEAVQYSVGSDLSLIKGPPGTGKTSVLYHIILELLRKGENILICCGSHAAIDNLLIRLQGHAREFPICRIGHPYRVNPQVRRFCSDTKRIDSIKKRRLKDARIIAGTLHAVYNLKHFSPCHTAVIDEVCQTIQAQSWIPFLNNSTLRRLVIAGDDQQLPPTIISDNKFVLETLNVTLYNVLNSCYGSTATHLLDTQYRMSESIMRFSSDSMYNGQVTAHTKVAKQRLYHIPRVQKCPVTEAPILWIDTSVLGPSEEMGPAGSLSNLTEATIVKQYCLKLERYGLELAKIGVITPYAHQKRLISEIYSKVEVNTIDGYQGKERDVIILSLVRSNAKGAIGFLADERRLNVAITRSKYQLCIVANMQTLKQCQSVLLRSWVEWCENKACVVQPIPGSTTVDYDNPINLKQITSSQ